MKGQTCLLTSWAEPEKEDRGNGMWSTTITAGEPHDKAIFEAVVDRWHSVLGRPKPSQESFADLIGQKVTVLTVGENFIGGRLLAAREGRVFASGPGYAILPKGSRNNGFVLDARKIHDVLPGWAAADAAEMVRKVRSTFPTLKALTQDRLLELPPSSNTLDLCLFGTYRMPDGQQSDAIVLAGEYSGEEDDIVDGGVCLLRPEVGVSEHGSFYGRDLLRLHVLGEVVGYQPISFAEGLALCELPFDAAYERLLGNCVAVA